MLTARTAQATQAMTVMAGEHQGAVVGAGERGADLLQTRQGRRQRVGADGQEGEG